MNPVSPRTSLVRLPQDTIRRVFDVTAEVPSLSSGLHPLQRITRAAQSTSPEYSTAGALSYRISPHSSGGTRADPLYSQAESLGDAAPFALGQQQQRLAWPDENVCAARQANQDHQHQTRSSPRQQYEPPCISSNHSPLLVSRPVWRREGDDLLSAPLHTAGTFTSWAFPSELDAVMRSQVPGEQSHRQAARSSDAALIHQRQQRVGACRSERDYSSASRRLRTGSGATEYHSASSDTSWHENALFSRDDDG